MKRLHASVAEFLRAEDGQTALEYAVMLSLIVTVCSLPVNNLGNNVNDNFAAAAEGADGSYAAAVTNTNPSSNPGSLYIYPSDTTTTGTGSTSTSGTTTTGTTSSGTTTTSTSTTTTTRTSTRRRW